MFEGFVREGELRRWAPFVIATLLILLAVAMQTSMESACWDEEIVRSAKINEAAGCFEFWFNRYQTVIGAIAALLAGFAAWQGAMKQVARADTQILLLGKQAAVDRIEYINAKLIPIDDLHQSLDRSRNWYNAAVRELANLRRCAGEICAAIDRKDGSHVAIFEQEYDPSTRKFDGIMFTVMTNITSVNNYRDNPLIPEEARFNLIELCYQLAEKYNYLETFKPRIRTPISIYSEGVDGLRNAYESIMRDDIIIPDPLPISETFIEVDRQRDKLLALRRAAEMIVEA